jgi:hypothetical protein
MLGARIDVYRSPSTAFPSTSTSRGAKALNAGGGVTTVLTADTMTHTFLGPVYCHVYCRNTDTLNINTIHC